MNKPTIEELEAQVKQLAAQLELSVAAERAWEKTMMRVCGEDGPLSVAGKFNQLVAENAALKMYISDECYVENKRTGLYACAGKGIPQVSATDAILASLRAEGVEMAVEAAKPEVASEFQRETFDQCVTAAVKYPQSDLAGKVEMVVWLEWFAGQLRSKPEVQHD